MTGAVDAASVGAPAVCDECPDDVSNIFEKGDKTATDLAFSGGLPVIMNALAHALEPLGVCELDMPLMSARTWQAIRRAGDEQSAPRATFNGSHPERDGRLTVYQCETLVRE